MLVCWGKKVSGMEKLVLAWTYNLWKLERK